MQNKIWLKRREDISRDTIAEFAADHGLPPLIATVLLNRGITDAEKVNAYLKKTLDGIHNPYLLPDMQAAVDRILPAIASGEKIVVYGDYDVDGITATALLVHFLRGIGANVDYYIPDRKNEGYGINVKAISQLSKLGTRLMVTVDCGITATGEVELAKTMGMDVIVTDHHLCKEKLPNAIAVVDAKRPDSEYPFDALAGVGVAFKLMLAVVKALGKSTKEYFFRYVDFAAIGTIADVVTLLDENRVIVEKGLAKLANSEYIGIRTLIETAGLNKKPVDSTAIAFSIAPRLNATGRLGSAKTAVELLLCEEEEKARELAQQLEQENLERRETEQIILKEAQELIAQDADFDKKQVIVLAKRDWHHGVIGIVASRIHDLYYRPCIIISLDEKGNGKGSGRSIPGLNLFEALEDSQELLTNYGGHAAAAGLGIAEEDLEAFTARINAYANSILTEEDKIPKILIDSELGIRHITLENAKLLSCLEPFGTDNEKPVFCIRNVPVSQVARVGAEGIHLRLVLAEGLQAVWFRMGAVADALKPGDRVDVAFSLEVNAFREKEMPQMMIRDLKKRA